jgi:outer membrane protein assembly factor BamB
VAGEEPLDGTEPVAEAAAADDTDLAGVRDVPVSLPGQTSNGDWAQRAGGADHAPGHVALGGSLSRVWSASVGRGDSRKTRIAADPVVSGGRVFTLDSEATVTATGTNGAALWQADLTPAADRSGEASGGGLATGGGQVFATTGFGELVALSAETGAVAWRQKFGTAAGGAPSFADGTVYAVARDGLASAIDAANGKILWQVQGIPDRAGVMGVSAPAVAGDRVIFPFASGQMLSVERATGASVWQAFVAGKRLGRAYANVSDVTGDPSVTGGVVYAGTAAGRLTAVYEDSGQPLWFADEGAASPVAVAGGALWLVNDENQLVRLDAATGETVWRIDMPYFTKEKDKRRKGIFVHYGPVLAGGRLVTVSSDGYVRSFSPASGALLSAVELPGGAASGAAIAGGTLYVVSRQGQLHAFR